MVHEDFLDGDISSDEGVEIPVEFEDEAEIKDSREDPASDQDSLKEPVEASDSPENETEGASDLEEEDETPEPAETGEDIVEESADLQEEDGTPESAREECPDEEPAESEEDEAGGPEDKKEEESKAAEEQEEKSGESEKHGIFGFKKKDKEKEKLQGQLKDLNDRLLRSMAEFDNFRKRTEREKSAMYGMGAEDMAKKMLPIVDSFERGLAQTSEGEAENGNPFAEGMRMIYKQMLTALAEAGVEPIEAVGKEFDPNIHNAVMHVDDEEEGENVVVDEFQKGYTYKGNVIRHSMVKVAN